MYCKKKKEFLLFPLGISFSKQLFILCLFEPSQTMCISSVDSQSDLLNTAALVLWVHITLYMTTVCIFGHLLIN